jgi:tol-pal system protein YbgF
MYIDLDERMQQLENNTSANNANSSSSTETIDNTVTNAGMNEPTEQADSGTAPVSVENGEAAYQAALQTLRSGQYQEAIDALAKFPEQYPGSVYLPNAYYWQGEAKYVLRQFADAAALFQIVIDEYPASSKVADALLKRGFSEQEMGDSQRAQATLSQVIDTYPNSSAARLAKARLERINQSSN